MKKFFCIIALFISVAISAGAQETFKDLREGFRNGSFYVECDEWTLMFKAVEVTEYKNGKIKEAVFETVVNDKLTKKGEELFKEMMWKKANKDAYWSCINYFNKNYGIVMAIFWDGVHIAPNGRVRTTMGIRPTKEEYENGDLERH